MNTDEAIRNLCEAMREFGAGIEFEVALGEMVGKVRAAHEARMRDAEVAKLLHYGWRPLADRYGVCKATVYNMAERARGSKRDAAA